MLALCGSRDGNVGQLVTLYRLKYLNNYWMGWAVKLQISMKVNLQMFPC